MNHGLQTQRLFDQFKRTVNALAQELQFTRDEKAQIQETLIPFAFLKLKINVSLQSKGIFPNRFLHFDSHTHPLFDCLINNAYAKFAIIDRTLRQIRMHIKLFSHFGF